MQKRKRSPATMTLSLLLMLATALGVGIARFLFWQYRSGLRGPMGLLGIPLVLCPFIGLVILFGALCAFLVGWSLYQSKSVLPTLVLALGIFLVFQIPLPPPPPTPETLYFWAHRADYEAVVELAKRNELKDSDCQDGYRSQRLSHVSAEHCLVLFHDEKSGLQLQFYPLEGSYHSIHYTEIATDADLCVYDAMLEQRIDAHWYVCQEDWN